MVIDEAGSAEVTDANGDYRLDYVPAGSYTLVFTFGCNVHSEERVEVANAMVERRDVVVDLVPNYRINDNWGVGVSLANLLDEQHRESFGGDIIGRRGLVNIKYGWR